MPGRKSKQHKTKSPSRRTKSGKSSFISRALSTAARMAGGAIGGPVIGSALGDLAAGLIPGITGQGDYKIQGNSLLDSAGPPVFDGKVGLRLRHREYIGDLKFTLDSNFPFNVYKYPINPGHSGTFPWLSEIAPSFEQYKIHGLVFEMKSLVQPLTTTTPSLGAACAFVNYDVLSNPVYDRRTFEAYEGSVSGPVTKSLIVPLECKPNLTPVDLLLVRDPLVPPVAADVRFHDMGNLFIGIDSTVSGGQQAFELWVSYDVSFLKPKAREVPISAAWVTSGSPHNDSTQCILVPVSEITSPGAYELTSGRFYPRRPGLFIYLLQFTRNTGTDEKVAPPLFTLTNGRGIPIFTSLIDDVPFNTISQVFGDWSDDAKTDNHSRTTLVGTFQLTSADLGENPDANILLEIGYAATALAFVTVQILQFSSDGVVSPVASIGFEERQHVSLRDLSRSNSSTDSDYFHVRPGASLQ